jgi:hypothetical protein
VLLKAPNKLKKQSKAAASYSFLGAFFIIIT